MSYAAHRMMVAPAEARPGLWRLLGGCLLAGVVAFVGAQGMILAMIVASGRDPVALLQSGTATPPHVTLVFLLALGCLGAGTILAARLFQKRRAASLFGPARLALRQAGRVALALLLLQLVMSFALALLVGTPDLRSNLPPLTWLALLPLSLAAILIQTGSEELFFRGYLQSQLAARFRHPLVWLALPSLIFAAGHFAAAYGENALAVAGWAGLFGLAAADLTARSGTLGPALAFHAVNNALVLLFVSMEGPLSGLALFTLSFGPWDTRAVAEALPLDLISLAVGWAVARWALRGA